MALAHREATVTWSGTLAGGDGELRLGGGATHALPMDWASRSGDAHGTTSPEELLAAAHAGCYAMTLALALARRGHEPRSLDVGGTCDLEPSGDDREYRIARLALQVVADVDGLDPETFDELARHADAQCPVAEALRGGVELVLDARLTGA